MTSTLKADDRGRLTWGRVFRTGTAWQGEERADGTVLLQPLAPRRSPPDGARRVDWKKVFARQLGYTIDLEEADRILAADDLR